MKRNIIIAAILIFSVQLNAKNIPGFNIEIFKMISGIWGDPKYDINLKNCKNCYVMEFGWGKSNSYVNSFTIIDPIGDNFHFAGLHSLSFKSFKQIDINTVDVDLYFITGSIHKYRIKRIKEDYIVIKDIGSIDKYDIIIENHKRVEGPDFKKCKIGKIKGGSIRIRKSSGSKSHIEGLIANEAKIITVLQSSSKEKIGNDEYYWYKVVSDNGDVGWIYGKYIKFVE